MGVIAGGVAYDLMMNVAPLKMRDGLFMFRFVVCRTYGLALYFPVQVLR
jgi:hypothetical protein